MMRQVRTAIAAALVAAVLLLGGCGASSAGDTASAWAGGNKTAASAPSAAPMKPMENGWYEDAVAEDAAEAPSLVQSASGSEQAAKRIYQARLELETTEFDKAQQEILALTEELGGYLESSSVGEYGSGYRRGDFTVRIPAEQFQFFLKQAGQLCHVTWQSSSCQDVSEYYYDTAGRLETQRTKLSRLQELLSRAENMEDIITLENAISDTEMNIEYLSGELQHYDALVDYSTVSFSLQEVYRFTETEETATGFGQRMGSALASGWHNFTAQLEELIVAVAYNWVWLAVLVVIAGVALRRISRRRREKAKKTAAQEGDKP